MKQLGIKSRELDVKEVRFVFSNGEEWIFKNPQVIETEAMGQKVYQVSGEYEEGVDEESVKIVMEQTGVSREKAVEALKESGGDIAEAIMKLSENLDK